MFVIIKVVISCYNYMFVNDMFVIITIVTHSDLVFFCVGRL